MPGRSEDLADAASITVSRPMILAWTTLGDELSGAELPEPVVEDESDLDLGTN